MNRRLLLWINVVAGLLSAGAIYGLTTPSTLGDFGLLVSAALVGICLAEIGMDTVRLRASPAAPPLKTCAARAGVRGRALRARAEAADTAATHAGLQREE